MGRKVVNIAERQAPGDDLVEMAIAQAKAVFKKTKLSDLMGR